MHFTKPALVVASFLWATAFASPINSPAILRTRGLVGDTTTGDNTKDIAGSTTAGNAVGNDNTKSVPKDNAVEDAIGSLNLDDVTGGLTAREPSKHHHSHKNEADNIVKGAVGDVGGGTRGNSMGDDANGAIDDSLKGHPQGPSIDGASRDNTGDNTNDAKSDGDSMGGLLGGLFVRDNDGSVHDANKAVHDANKAAVHDANKAVHDANKIVHDTLHGLLHGILR